MILAPARRRPSAAEVRRLRDDLYRRTPPADALERYRAVAGPAAAFDAERDGRDPTAPVRTTHGAVRGARTSARRRRRIGTAAAAAALAATVALVVPLLAAPDPHAAQALVPGGPSAVSDRGVLDSLLGAEEPDPDALVRAVRGSGLAQLSVWRDRDAGAWTMQGTGPRDRRYPAGRSGTATAQPISILVRCTTASGYRWRVSGTTAAEPADHVLGSARAAACGRDATVATFVLPAGAVVRRFDFETARDASWGMALVYPRE